MKLLRTIAVGLLIASLAMTVRADGGSGGGGGGSSGGSGGSGGGGSDDNHGGPSSVGGSGRGAPGGPSGKEVRSARSIDGAYTVSISGYFTGSGTATVSATSVTLTLTVKSDAAGSITFQSDALPLSGPYFEGSGSAGDTKLVIKGRLDAAKQSRLLATYSTVGDNHHGRIAGTPPADTPNDKWDDDSAHH